MELQRSVLPRILGTLTLGALLHIGAAEAAVVPVAIDCPGGVGSPLRVTPDVVAVSAGDIVEWRIDFTCAGGACNPFFYEIVIDPCDPLFPLGFNSGMIPMTQPVSSPLAEANGGLCKYAVNLYNGSGDPCQTLDPYILGQPRVPALDARGLVVLALLLGGAAWWMLGTRAGAEGTGSAS